MLPPNSNFCVLRETETDRKSARKALLLSNIIATLLKKLKLQIKLLKLAAAIKLKFSLAQYGIPEHCYLTSKSHLITLK